MLQKIDIDWDIHRLIENERRGFDEMPHLALRRLLGLPERKAEEVTSADNLVGNGVPWTEDGVTVPHGSLARMKYDYGRQVYEGTFSDGVLKVEDRSFASLSEAAKSLARTKAGGRTELNGWKYWEVKFPGSQNWVSLWDLREELRSN